RQHLVAAPHEVELQCGSHAEEHLQLEAVAADSLALREGETALDQGLVMGGDRRIRAAAERRLDEPEVRLVDVGLVRVGDVRRLEIGALHEAQIGRERKQRLEVMFGTKEVGLEHGADTVVTRLAQPAIDAEGRVDDVRLLHVDPDEAAEPLGDLHDLLDIRVRDLLVELEAEMGQLECDVARQILRMETLEHTAVLARDRLRLAAVANALAEQRRVRVEPLIGEATQDGDARVEVLARDEARRAEPHPVAAHEALDMAIVGGAQDPRAEHGVRTARDGHAARAPTSAASQPSSSAISAGSRSRRGGRTSGRRGTPFQPATRLSAAWRGNDSIRSRRVASPAAPSSVGARTTDATSSGNADASADTAPIAPASRPRWISASGPTKMSNPSSRYR